MAEKNKENKLKINPKSFNKLNLGCGINYWQGWVNLDFNKEVKADVYADFEKKLPFEDNTFDHIYTHYVLEHTQDFFRLMDELYRICKPNATIEVYVPHFTSIYSTKYAYHHQTFGIGSFIMFTSLSDNKQKHGKVRFGIIKEELRLLCEKDKLSWRIFHIVDKLFNQSKRWQQVWERLFVFDEVYYKLKVLK